jgi:capsid protein
MAKKLSKQAIEARLAFLEDKARRIGQRVGLIDKAMAKHERQIAKHLLAVGKLKTLREELVEVFKEINRHI